MEEIFGKIWNRLIFETELGRKLKDNGISVLYRITEPDMAMYIDENGAVFGQEAEARTPDITESMTSDNIHKFLLKKIDMPQALAQDQIKAKGSATKMLLFLPLLEFVQEVYPEYCRQFNLPMD